MGESKLKPKPKPKPRPRRCIRQLTFMIGVVLAIYCLLFVYNAPDASYGATSWSALRKTSTKLTPELLNNLSLGEDECKAAFPGLTKEIDDTVAKGPFIIKPSGELGPLQGRIADGQLYILHAQRRNDLSQDMLNARTAALHQLHRAILTSPFPLPDTVFTLNTGDAPFGTALQYSRAADPLIPSKNPNTRSFLIPHFSFWSWPLPFIGSISSASSQITALEASYSPNASHPNASWRNKIPRAVWRGTAWYNSVHSPRLRQNLLQATKDKPWADVQVLNWTTTDSATGQKSAINALHISEFCRYKYIIHTEGVAYSGRFPFTQMCKSVVLTPPILWMMHTTHLVRPVYSGYLLGRDKKGWEPAKRAMRGWGTGVKKEEANMVFVEGDWSDLEETVEWLERHPDVAEGIARRQRELVVGGGYHSPAAEACYWRAAIKGWASRVRAEGEWEGLGIPFEAFSLSLDMRQ
ncbi:glycosyl transferase family 90-domain-containing protein [Podospora aff. communis PSN243]|uniref:Glycosyl transferase family 90-domain-containing protein n=1 Tax=Podospora aff. communis PSN243 TaxID=3040156 RepID=A0AAV9GHT0_9PEZI|nr:glycosyl transferase family 90-domain-containing protein [Podospora aff. communis PSN243]